MDYTRHYERLMDRARARSRPSGYVERHHVVPRCLGGSNDASNKVILTAAEHYVAHLLLVRMYPGNSNLTWAAIAMAVATSAKNQGRSGNKLYDWLRREHAEARRGKKRGRIHSDASRAKMSADRRGKKLGPWSAENSAKHSARQLGKKRGPQKTEQVAARIAVHLGAKRSDETRAKMSAARKGKTFGPHSPERREKIAAAQRGRVFTEEHLANIAAAARARSAKRTPLVTEVQ